MRLKAYLISIAVSIFLVCVAVYYGSMNWLNVKHVQVKLKGLPEQLKGLKILHISDLHGNSPDSMNVDIWSEIENLEFDIAVITGDLTVTKLSELSPHLGGFKSLAAKAPTYFVDGNHDRFYYRELKQIFDGYGIITLENESVLLYGGSLELSGFRDFSYFNSQDEIASAITRKNPGAFLISLFHQPQLYDYLDEKPGLSLCGHTHGGQLRLPFFPTLYAPGQGFFPKYGDGLYELDGNKMYISRGIGTTVFPIRFFNRPEIAVITIT